jgi:hypothetical protein
MTSGTSGTSGGGGGDKPPRSELRDDPMQHPASEAGWDDAAPARPAAPGAAATAPSTTPPSTTPPSTTPPSTTPPSTTPPSTTPSSVTPPSTTSATPPSSAATKVPAPTPAAAPSTTSAASPSTAATKAPAAPSAASPSTTSAASPPSTAATKAPAPTPAAAPSPAGTKAPASTPAATSSPASTKAASADDGPLLPATRDKNDLRAAVGASSLTEAPAATRKRRAPAADHRSDDDDEGQAAPPRSRTTIVVSALGITAGVAIVVLVLVGRANSDRYLLACEAARAVPEQGRGFPPWGTHALEGEPWKPLKISPETRCQPHETDDPLVLERLYLAMILDQATAMLTAREVTRLDDAEGLLKQALLLTRPPAQEPEKLAAERNEHHKDIERLLGDVTYWRASTRLHDAAAALADAAKQFDAAAAQHPRHVTDAEAWATYARKLAGELHAGPAGITSPVSPPTISASPPTTSEALPTGSAAGPAAPASEHPNVPTGVALPVEPDRGSADLPPAAPAPPDAGPPTGGVLL